MFIKNLIFFKVIFIIPSRDPPTLKEPNKWSKDFNDFIHICLKKKPEERPLANELMNVFILKIKIINIKKASFY